MAAEPKVAMRMTVLVSKDLHEAYRKAVRRQDMTVSQHVRQHMRDTVAADQERQAA